MADIDDIMATCPMKHEIRATLWDKYISKIKKSNIKYLTLYSPPLMDIKYFEKRGYLKIDQNKYSNVVGVYLPDKEKENYSNIISQGKARIGYLSEGDINDTVKLKGELKQFFPFDAINLDYCNYLYSNDYTPYISKHLSAIETIIELQKINGANEFSLFVTSRIDQAGPKNKGFASGFLLELDKVIALNLSTYIDWEKNFNIAFSNVSVRQLRENSYERFLTVGLTKLIAVVLARHDYKIVDTDAYRIVRDGRKHAIDLLHLAFHLKLVRGNRKKITNYTRPKNYEKDSKIILNKFIDNKIVILKETNDKAILQAKHGQTIQELNEENYEVKVPNPINK